VILDEIVAAKKKRLKDAMSRISIEGLKQRIKEKSPENYYDFFNAVKKSKDLSIIAEVKKASPSKGIIKENFEPVEIAKQYCKGGVEAVSVLTEQDFFFGCDDYLFKIRQAVPLPVLRKDFIIDIWQVYQSAYLGADAILLIASLLDTALLKKFLTVAGILGMKALVEVHDKRDVERALESGASIIGINNRNLKTFEVDIKTTERLLNLIPNDRAVVSESGIKTAYDFDYLANLGIDAVLIGEAFMRSDSINETIVSLRSVKV